MQTLSLQDLLGRPSLHYADNAYAVPTVPALCSKRASSIQHSFYLNLVLYEFWYFLTTKNMQQIGNLN